MRMGARCGALSFYGRLKHKFDYLGGNDMKSYAYYNGEYKETEQIRLPLSDRAIYFADAIYEVMIGKAGGIYQANEHLARLRANAGAIGLCMPVGIESIIYETIKRSECSIYTVYIQLSASGTDRAHAQRVDGESNLLVVVSEASLDEKCGEISAVTCEDIRYRMCDKKTTNLLPAVIASITAKEAGAEEAILIRDGIVTEGSKSNLFLLFGDTLLTHPLDRDILPGITRANILNLAPRLGLRVCEQKFSAKLLREADEVIISSTTKLIRRVVKIDGAPTKSSNEELVEAIYTALYNNFLS